MPFDLTNGYQPRTFTQLLDILVENVNSEFGTSYDSTTIIGTDYYKIGYSMIQMVMQAESYTAEISARMTDYIRTANEQINLPKSTIDGFVDGLKRELELDSTIKEITDSAEAGYMFLVVDVDDSAEDYEEIKQKIVDRMHAWLTAGLYYNGAEEGVVVATNGQNFTYKYDLPTPVDILVRITVVASPNAKTPVFNENQVRDKFNANFAEFYRIGLNFEPEKYLEIARDLPFAADILLEYSLDDGANWESEPLEMAYDEKINITAPATVSVE